MNGLLPGDIEMEHNVQTFLMKIEKRIETPDGAKRVKCIHEIQKRMETSEECIVDGMEFLIRLLKDKDPWVRKEALNAMEGVVDLIMEQISREKDFLVRYHEKMVPVKKLLFYQAIQLTKDPDTGIRLHAVTIAGDKSLEYSLIREKATPFLMARIKDENKEVRNAAIGYIIKISQHFPELTRPFLQKLYTAKKQSTDVYVTYILDKTMIKHHFPEFVPLFFGKLNDADINTEKYIVSALVKCGIRDLDLLKPDLVKGLTDQSDILWWVSARNMMMILSRVAEKHPENTRPYLRYILPLLTNENREIRRLAAETVGMMGTGEPDRVKEALATLVDLVKDPDGKVKETAIASLERMGISEDDFERVRNASASLNDARLIIMDLKKQNDLTERIRDSYFVARQAFSQGDYQRSFDFSNQSIISSRTRNQLRSHAEHAIQSADFVLNEAAAGGMNTSSISTRVEEARKAYQERKYFLAHELIYKSKIDADLLGQSNPLADPYEMDPGMESRIDTMVCHLCGESISKGNTNCSGCGSRLESTSCAACSTTVPQGFQFCAGCGEHLDNVCEVCGAINRNSVDSCDICGGHLNHTTTFDEPNLELDVKLIPR